ncbi:hypothetical protein C1646_754070 [Rhizophagus diaphanus]|nr:hypothetical protein C1646_754070 [Rhizophagus diaphanus] [Rhizophagus sp. MUCL 43196]
MDKDNLIDSLVLHSYDADLMKKHSKRSFNSTKLIEFLFQNLKNTNDYLKSLGKFFRIPEIQKYLKIYLIPIPADFSSQLYIRRAIVQKLKPQECSTIPNEITHLVPFLGPLHVTLNTKESGFLTFWIFFNEMFKATFQTIFLSKFFNNLWNNLGTVEIKSEGKKIKKSYWYFSGIAKGFIKDALPLEYHTKQIPCKTSCDYNESALYNEQLEMDGNIDDEFDSPHQEIFLGIIYNLIISRYLLIQSRRSIAHWNQLIKTNRMVVKSHLYV